MPSVRTQDSTRLDLSRQRVLDSLPARREPYWSRVRTGLFVGYRKLADGTGTWIARLYNDEKRQQYHALGPGVSTLDAATVAAVRWADAMAMGVRSVDSTVGDACRAYVEHQKARKGSKAAADPEGRFKRLVYGKPIENVPLAKLTTVVFRKWLNAQVLPDDDADDAEDVRRSKDSANRNLASLKAALNLAYADRLVATDAGWATVVPFPGVGKRRDYLLSPAERGALLAACPDDLRLLVRALLLTAARPGEIAACTAADFDKAQGTLVLAGKTGRRVVTLSTAARALCTQLAEGAIGKAPLLRRADGQAWNKDAWKWPFKDAVAAAGLPSLIVMYHLRHAAISEMIAAGMDGSIVAKLAGTSTAMIDKHYGHLRHDKTRAMLDAVNL